MGALNPLISRNRRHMGDTDHRSKLLQFYASWKPDSEAAYQGCIFDQLEWSFLFYAFPPFSLIAQCLQETEMEKSEDIMIFPMSDTQPWYSQLLRMLKDVPRTLPQRSDTLKVPGGKGMAQPLVKKMTLMVCRVSRRSLKTQGI